ncbi:MAG TPA: hypothetical protein VMY99_02680 [Nevskiaceae bacterium]|nr:hypothetical protein [Nevskiaceae bacterium]
MEFKFGSRSTPEKKLLARATHCAAAIIDLTASTKAYNTPRLWRAYDKAASRFLRELVHQQPGHPLAEDWRGGTWDGPAVQHAAQEVIAQQVADPETQAAQVVFDASLIGIVEGQQ